MIPMALGTVATAVGAVCEPPAADIRVHRITTDSRRVHRGDLFVAIPGKRYDGHQFIPEAIAKGAVACLCDGDWFDTRRTEVADHTIPLLVVENTVEALGKLAAYYRREVMHPKTVAVAVTGSNGKTTTKAMLDHVLGGSLKGRAAPASYNNHLGVPLTLLSADAGDRYLIVEIGSNARGEVAALAAMTAPDVAVITGIGEAHLEGLGGIDGVAAEKASLLEHVRPGGLAVVNIDRPQIRPHLNAVSCVQLLTFGMNREADLRVVDVLSDLNGTTFRLEGNVMERAERKYVEPNGVIGGPYFDRLESRSHRLCVELPMPGVHHASNAAAVFAVARRLGLTPKEIITRLRSFRPLEGRGRVLEVGGITIVDDAYNANPVSMAGAINTLKSCFRTDLSRGLQPARRYDRLVSEHLPARTLRGRRVLVMGEMLELGTESASFHREAIMSALEAGIETLVTVGPAMAEAVSAVRDGEANVDARAEIDVGARRDSRTGIGGIRRGSGAGARIPSRIVPGGRRTRVIPCADAAEASDVLMTLLSPDDTVWIKGSRAVGLDRVVRDLEVRYRGRR